MPNKPKKPKKPAKSKKERAAKYDPKLAIDATFGEVIAISVTPKKEPEKSSSNMFDKLRKTAGYGDRKPEKKQEPPKKAAKKK